MSVHNTQDALQKKKKTLGTASFTGTLQLDENVGGSHVTTGFALIPSSQHAKTGRVGARRLKFETLLNFRTFL